MHKAGGALVKELEDSGDGVIVVWRLSVERLWDKFRKTDSEVLGLFRGCEKLKGDGIAGGVEENVNVTLVRQISEQGAKFVFPRKEWWFRYGWGVGSQW